MVKLWDVATGKEVLLPAQHAGGATALALSSDGRWGASSGADKLVTLWDVRTGKNEKSVRGHGAKVTALAFCPGKSQLASASFDKTVRIWNVPSWEELLCFTQHGWAVNDVAFSPEGTHLASVGGDRKIKIWDAKTGKSLRDLEIPSGAAHSVAFSPDASHLACGGGDVGVIVWDLATGKRTFSLTPDENGKEHMLLKPEERRVSMAFSHDSKRIVTANSAGAVTIWDAGTGQKLLTLTGHAGPITRVAVSSDGTRRGGSRKRRDNSPVGGFPTRAQLNGTGPPAPLDRSASHSSWSRLRVRRPQTEWPAGSRGGDRVWLVSWARPRESGCPSGPA